jgi:hypothetical protein
VRTGHPLAAERWLLAELLRTLDSTVELMSAAAFTRCGAETKLVLPGLEQQNHSSRCDPALIKAIARSRSWPSVTASPGATFDVSLAWPS